MTNSVVHENMKATVSIGLGVPSMIEEDPLFLDVRYLAIIIVLARNESGQQSLS